MLGVVIFLATMVAGAALLRGDGTVDTRSARPAPSSAAEGSPTDLPTTPVVAAGVEPTAAVLEPAAATAVKAPTVRTTTPALAAQTAATPAPTQQVVATPAAPTAVPPKSTVAEPTPTPTMEPPRPAPTTARPTRSQVAVVTGEQRAVLVIDGVVRGRTPRAVSLPPGKHEVVVYSRTHERMTRSVNLQAGRRTRLALDMTPRRAKLEVLAGTNKAIVLVDGKRRGRTPLETTVKPGRHTITVQRAGHREWSQYIRFTPAGRKVVRVRLQAKLARFDVSTTPQDAAIYIDNKWRGYTNRVIYGVKPGYHTIVLYKAGRRRIVMRHKFGPDGQITVRSRLVRVAPPGPPRVAVPLRHRPLAVMIENHPNARPQSGLDFADVVLEAPAEFGISRFIAFFMSRDVPVVGPVRSAREYFVLWASEFNPIYFHAGGSPGAASLADRIGLTRTNALWDGRAFYRTNDRYSPHNLYTSTAALLRVERAKGRGLQSGSWGGLRFKPPGTALGPESATYARLGFNSYYYAEWLWDAVHGVYRRSMQGQPHIERNTGAQVSATAVIVRVHNVTRIPGDAKAREDIETIGSGAAYIFQDGRLTRATWRKRTNSGPTEYVDGRGRTVAVNKGGVWIQVIPKYGSVNWR